MHIPIPRLITVSRVILRRQEIQLPPPPRFRVSQFDSGDGTNESDGTVVPGWTAPPASAEDVGSEQASVDATVAPTAMRHKPASRVVMVDLV